MSLLRKLPAALAAAAFLPGAWGVAAQAAQAETFRTKYAASLTGLPVGELVVDLDLADGAYAIDGKVKVRGFARIFSDGKGEASAAGRLDEGAVAPSEFHYRYREKDDDDRVTLRFDGSRIAAIEPEPKKRGKKRIPVTEAHLSDVLDPLSAALIPAAADESACDRTLPIFDGEKRYDLAMSFRGTETISGGKGAYSGPAVVCSVRYEPVAGHRADHKDVRSMEKASIEVWLAPLGDAGAMFPVRLKIGTGYGPLVIEAQRFGRV